MHPYILLLLLLPAPNSVSHVTLGAPNQAPPVAHRPPGCVPSHTNQTGTRPTLPTHRDAFMHARGTSANIPPHPVNHIDFRRHSPGGNRAEFHGNTSGNMKTLCPVFMSIPQRPCSKCTDGGENKSELRATSTATNLSPIVQHKCSHLGPADTEPQYMSWPALAACTSHAVSRSGQPGDLSQCATGQPNKIHRSPTIPAPDGRVQSSFHIPPACGL